MAERPILFSGPMVRAILDGRKTQTLRVLKPQPDSLAPIDHIEHVVGTRSFDLHTGARFANGRFQGSERMQMVATPYAPGDRLWVREAWKAHSTFNGVPPRDIPDSNIFYLADPGYSPSGAPGRPGIHMPRWASRITLEVTKVRIQRLQDISEEDAIAEGIRRDVYSSVSAFDDPAMALSRSADMPIYYAPDWCGKHAFCCSAVAAFKLFWDEIHGLQSWAANPWVAAYTFKRVPQKAADGTERHSYNRAEAGMGSDADELAYRSAFRRGDTKEMARLDAESQQRMADFDARFPDETS